MVAEARWFPGSDVLKRKKTLEVGLRLLSLHQMCVEEGDRVIHRECRVRLSPEPSIGDAEPEAGIDGLCRMRYAGT